MAEVPSPDGIELLDKRFDECRIVGQYPVLEVALLLALRAHPGAGEVRRAEVRLNAVDDDAFEMHARDFIKRSECDHSHLGIDAMGCLGTTTSTAPIA